MMTLLKKISDLATFWKQRKARAMQRMWIRKGIALGKEDKLQEALVCFDNALRSDPLDPLPWQFKGGILLKLGKYREAKAAFQKFIDLAPPKFGGYVAETKEMLKGIEVILRRGK